MAIKELGTIILVMTWAAVVINEKSNDDMSHNDQGTFKQILGLFGLHVSKGDPSNCLRGSKETKMPNAKS